MIASELLSLVSDKQSSRENQFRVSFVSFKRDSFLLLSVMGLIAEITEESKAFGRYWNSGCKDEI